eukprot:12931290-Prorocentrum_lima.AAC.1
MKDFVESLEKNPMQGDELSPGIRKIRLAIVSKGKGKSGGARVITYTICASESEGRVYLVDVYDKSDFSTSAKVTPHSEAVKGFASSDLKKS